MGECGKVKISLFKSRVGKIFLSYIKIKCGLCGKTLIARNS